MRAVWSFWSVPYAAHYRHAWARPIDHLLSWVVSVHAAARHCPDTMLVTDTPGKALLADRLGLPFATVSTELDRLRGEDPQWWALGKLVAYSLQPDPFVHLDSDAYLWNPLPPHLHAAPVLAQNPERHLAGHDYRPGDIERAMRDTGGRLPAEWEWGTSRGPELQAENCGILGGQDAAFLRHYADSALALVLRPENRAGWRRLPDKWHHNFLIEQFLLSACIGFHATRASSRHRGVRAAYLFPSWTEAFDPNYAARTGYTHLMAGKRNPAAGRRLEARVRRDWPDHYRRCERWQGWTPAG